MCLPRTDGKQHPLTATGHLHSSSTVFPSPPIHNNFRRCTSIPDMSTCGRAIRKGLQQTPAFGNKHTRPCPSRRPPETPPRRSSAQNHRRTGSTPHQSPATCRKAKHVCVKGCSRSLQHIVQTRLSPAVVLGGEEVVHARPAVAIRPTIEILAAIVTGNARAAPAPTIAAGLPRPGGPAIIFTRLC